MRKLDLGRIAAAPFGGGARLTLVARGGEGIHVDLPRERALQLRQDIDAALAAPPSAPAADPAPAPAPPAVRKRRQQASA